MHRESAALTLDDVAFETTCLGRDNATVESLALERKLRGVAELQRQVMQASRNLTRALDPEQIVALLFQGARLLTASFGGEILGYAVVSRAETPTLCELLVSPRAEGLPLGPALLALTAEA